MPMAPGLVMRVAYDGWSMKLDGGLDTDLGEVVLDGLDQRGPGRHVVGVESGREAVGEAGLGEQMLGLGRVVAVEVAGGAVDVARQPAGDWLSPCAVPESSLTILLRSTAQTIA